MLRSIGGIVVGYLTMFIVVIASFMVAYLLMGTKLTFQPGSYQVSALWILMMVVLNFVAAYLGGLVCAAIARNVKATFVLAGVVLVLGVLIAIPVLTGSLGEPPATRPDTVGNLEAMQYARQPAWSSIASPILGAIGVLLGGRRKRKLGEGETPASS